MPRFAPPALLALALAASAPAQETPGRSWADRVQTRTLDVIPPDGVEDLWEVVAYAEPGHALIAYDRPEFGRVPTYWFQGTYHDLPYGAPDGRVREFVDVNANGVVLGNECASISSGDDCEPFLWTVDEGLEWLGQPTGDWCKMEYDKGTDDHTLVCYPLEGARGVALNADGDVAASTAPEGAAAYWGGAWTVLKGGHETDVGAANFYGAVDINAAGTVLGQLALSHAESVAATWAPGSSTPTEHRIDQPWTGAVLPVGIADDGSFVGEFVIWPGGGRNGAYVWSGGATVATLLPGADLDSRVWHLSPEGHAIGYLEVNDTVVWYGLGSPVEAPVPGCGYPDRTPDLISGGAHVVPTTVGPGGTPNRRRALILRPDETGLPECPPQSGTAEPEVSAPVVDPGDAFEVVVRLHNTGEAPLWNVRLEADDVAFEPAEGGAGGSPPSVTAPDPLEWLEIGARDSLVVQAVAADEGDFDLVATVRAEGPGGPVEIEVGCVPDAEAGLACQPTVTVGPSLVIIVTTNGDEEDPDLEDDFCDVDPDEPGPQCTLRAAILMANDRGGVDEIHFELEDGQTTIAPDSTLPALTEAVTLDGTTQPGTGTAPLVRLDGAGAGSAAEGLRVEADGVTVRGLAITRFASHGLHVAAGANGVLEALLVGTDATGADGLGNGGDGIHVSGGTGLRVGGLDGARARPGSAINLGVISVSNLLNGLYLRDEDNAALVRARRAGLDGVAEPRFIGINIAGFQAGLVEALGEAVARPNGQNGLCLVGANGVTLDRITVSDAVRHALEIRASQNVSLLSGRFGLRRPGATVPGLIGQIGESAIKISESIGVTVGSDDPGADPVEGGASGGWFMDVEASESVAARNVFAGLFDGAPPPPEVLEALRNLAGGIRVADSPDVTVGAEGVPTVLANNGGDAGQPQAGLFATGELTSAFRALNLHLGTTPAGLLGLGNLGSGLEIADGVPGAVLGGDTPAQGLVSGGNGGYGFLFRDLEAPPASSGAQAINILSGRNLASDLVEAVGAVEPVPNTAGGFCLLRVLGARLEALSAGPSEGHGLEILDSERVEVLTAQIGSLFERTVDEPADVMGPLGDGIHVNRSALVALGRLLNGPAPRPGFFVHGTGGRGISATDVLDFHVSRMAVGAAPAGSAETPDVFEALGAAFEGISLSNAVGVQMDSLLVLGSGRTSGGGGIAASGVQLARIVAAQFGEVGPDGQPRRTNAGPALQLTTVDSMRVLLSRFVGHAQAVNTQLSSVLAEGNTFESQQAGPAGAGDAIHQIGGLVEGLNNTFQNTSGAVLRALGGGEAVLRHNNIEGSGEGVVVEGGSARAVEAVVAPGNWWGDPSGPSGVGPGSGDPVSAGVDYAGWLAAPVGVVVTPGAHVVEADVLEEVGLEVTFASPLVGADDLDVTVTDTHGWVTSEAAFEVAVPAGGAASRPVALTVADARVDVVTVRAVSQTDPTLVGEATVRIVPPGAALALASEAPAGSTTLDVEAGGTLEIGDAVLVNPGGATEERGVVAAFGSVVLEAPLRFRHRAGERVVPAGVAPPPGTVSVVVDGGRGARLFGPPVAGLTVDDLAAQNLVRGVPGYYPDYPEPTLWTAYDPVAGVWTPSAGAGEPLPLGRAFLWYLLDRDGVGDPEVSQSRALPFALSAPLPANAGDVTLELETAGNRFNMLANPFGEPLDLTGAASWPGGAGIRSPLYVYDAEARTWAPAPAQIGPWEAFRFRARGPRRNGSPRLLTIPSAAAGARPAAARAIQPGLAFRLEGLDAAGRPLGDRMLTVAFADSARAGFDPDEDVEKFQPPATAYALLGTRADGQWLGLDARPFAPAEVPLALEARGAASTFMLSWDASALPDGLPVTLVDLATGAEVDVRKTAAHRFEAAPGPPLEAVPTHDLADGAAATDRFVLRIGDRLAARGGVDALGLEAPAPNPTSGVARVGFAVPEAGPVRLAAYDVRGREVAVLVDASLEAGRHEAGLDATALAAGVYVVRLEAGGGVLTRRATVVR